MPGRPMRTRAEAQTNTARPSPVWHLCRFALFVFFGVALSVPVDAAAQDDTVRKTSLSSVNLNVQWRTWRSGLQQPGTPPFDVLTQLHRTATSLGHRNLPAHSLSLTHRALPKQGGEARASAQQMFEMAAHLSPGLAEPHLAAAWHTIDTNPGNLPRILGQFQAGIRAGLGWPETVTSWTVDLAVFALLAALAAWCVFTLGQVLRHFGVVAHDLSRLLPAPFSRNQCAALLIVAAAALWLVFETWLIPAVALLGICSLPQRPIERGVTLVFAALLALLPTLDRYLAAPATFAGSPTHRIHAAHYEGCDAECRTWLSARGNDSETSDVLDPLVRYTRALVTLRQDSKTRWKAAAESIDPSEFDGRLRPWATLLKGTTLVALERPEEALPLLKSAREALPETAAPVFNAGRAHQSAGNSAAAEQAFADALDIDLERTRRKSELSRFDPASRLMLPRLPTSLFVDVHRDATPAEATVLRPAWRAYAWSDESLSSATPLGIALIAATLLGAVFGRLGWISRVCPRCGMAREPKDADRGGGDVECLPCVETTTGGPNRSYSDRVQQDAALERRDRVRRWLPRLLALATPGAGRVYMGWPIKGVAVAWFVGFSVCLMTIPTVVGRPIHGLFWSDWLGTTAVGTILGAVLLLIVVLTAWYGIAAWRPPVGRS